MNLPPVLPLVKQIPYNDPVKVFSKFCKFKGSLLLHSAPGYEQVGRYSYIAFAPFSIVSAKGNKIEFANEIITGNPFDYLQHLLKKFPQDSNPNLPPFQGGVAGYFSYDLLHHVEDVPHLSEDDMKFPDLKLGFYDLIVAFDHFDKQAMIISCGYPEIDKERRISRAHKRIKEIESILKSKSMNVEITNHILDKENIVSNFSKVNYLQTIQKILDYIYAGDIFEANLTQRFSLELSNQITPWQLFLRLNKKNPAPYSAFINFSDVQLVSASPERFLSLKGSHVQTRPIKGTRPRSQDEAIDKKLALELINSEKDNAENLMIVDLMRNDLSRVCEDHSVHVKQLCGLESFASVHHLVSVIEGILLADKTAVDLIKLTFPGGSITGAPKIRAMEIITECEPTTRGPYCGSIGYIGFNGNMDTSITIRTFAIKDKKVTFQAGGAIVADSNPEEEYQECITKVAPLIDILTIAE